LARHFSLVSNGLIGGFGILLQNFMWRVAGLYGHEVTVLKLFRPPKLPQTLSDGPVQAVRLNTLSSPWQLMLCRSRTPFVGEAQKWKNVDISRLKSRKIFHLPENPIC
jgi:hypothetical protein